VTGGTAPGRIIGSAWPGGTPPIPLSG
jgi:hypothetical protein